MRRLNIIGAALVCCAGVFWWLSRKPAPPKVVNALPGQTPTTSSGLDYLNFDFEKILFPWSSPATNQPTTKPYLGIGGTMEPTKGIRNNNPLNVEYSERNPWQGQTGTDGRFAVFETAFYGIRAAARTMKTYRDKHGLKTIEAIVNRWAPPSDNNPTQNYINFVANKAGVTATKPLSMADYPRVVAAMIHFENGYNPYERSEISSATAAGFK